MKVIDLILNLLSIPDLDIDQEIQVCDALGERTLNIRGVSVHDHLDLGSCIMLDTKPIPDEESIFGGPGYAIWEIETETE